MPDPNNDISVRDKAKIRRLNLKIKHLSEELDQAHELSSEYESQFQRMINDLQVSLGLKDPEPEKSNEQSKNPPPDISSSSANDPLRQPSPEALKNDHEDIRHDVENHSSKADPWMKKLYKKIASKTHPDKVCHMDISPYEKAEYQRLFDMSKQAIQDLNGSDLVYAAEQLGIDCDLPVEMRLKMLVDRGEKIKKEIYTIYKKPSWIWGESYGKPEVRKKILAGFCKIYGLKVPGPDFFDEFLSKVEC